MLFSPKKSRQQVQGEKQRRKNQENSRATIAELHNTIARLEVEKAEEERQKLDALSRAKGLEEERDIYEQKLEEGDEWVKATLQCMSAAGRAEFRTAARAAAPSFPVGTNRRLRRTIGLNVSMSGIGASNEDSVLRQAVRDFAVQHSMEVPDARKAAKGIRYYVNYLSVLHQVQWNIVCSV